MRRLYVRPGETIKLGRRGENEARQWVYDFSRWVDLFGEGHIQLVVQRPGECQPYPVPLEIEGENAVWTVTNIDTSVVGTGKAEFQYFVGDTLEKSIIFTTNILESLSKPGPVPEPQEDWVKDVLGYANSAKESASAAEVSESNAGKSAKQAVASAKQAAESAETAEQNVKTALQEAKESGEFDGPRGKPGMPPVVGDNGNWHTWDGEKYIDTGYSATALHNENGGGLVKMWFGTIAEYNALDTIYNDVLYHIIEGAIPV